jgi:hypothetical protein
MAKLVSRPLTLLAGLLFGTAGIASVGECLDGSVTTIAGQVRTVEGGTIAAQPNARFTVAAVDEKGRIVTSQSTDDAFQLTVPNDHDYVLMVSTDGGALGPMVWGEDERPEFAARGERINLGCVGLNPSTGRAFALRELDLRRPLGPANGTSATFLITEE